MSNTPQFVVAQFCGVLAQMRRALLRIRDTMNWDYAPPFVNQLRLTHSFELCYNIVL